MAKQQQQNCSLEMQKNPSRISAQALFVFSRWIFSNFLLLSTMQQHLEVCIKKRSSKKQK